MAQSKIKVKIVEFINNLIPGKPTQYKPVLQTPTMVSVGEVHREYGKRNGSVEIPDEQCAFLHLPDSGRLYGGLG